MGVMPIVYLHTISKHDWAFWSDFLRHHQEVEYVAKEFQTGLGRREHGLSAIAEAARLQEQTGRNLHFVAIGAAQYANDIAKHFDSWTIVDSTPFMKAVKRRLLATAIGTRVRWASARGEDPNVLLNQNVASYGDWLRELGVRHSIQRLARTGT